MQFQAPRKVTWMTSAIVLAGLAVFAGADAGAQTKKAAKKAAAATPGHTHEIIAELRSAHRYLEEANHDYKGHRAKASHEIMQAIHQLQKHHHHHHKTALQTAAVPYPHPQHHHHVKGIKEPQALSDAQVKAAGDIVRRVQSQVSGLPNNRHSVLAVKHVNDAAVQIQDSLAASPLVTAKSNPTPKE
jgi:hypothetical protein